MQSHINFLNDFIHNEIILPELTLNKTQESGDHTGLILSAAKKADLQTRKVMNGFYFYDGGRCIGGVREMKTSLISSISVSVCARKETTKELMRQGGVAVPKGVSFLRSQQEEALAYFNKYGLPVVIKPTSAAAGKGITVGISNEADFHIAWEKAVAASPTGGRILIEEVIEGVDVRVYVISGKAVASATRVPPFVVGDGVMNVTQLVENLNIERKQHKYLGRMPAIIDEVTLSHQNLAPHSIPEKEKIVVLNMAVNMHQGGVNMDVTKRLHPGLEAIAIHAAQAIPGLGAAGIDLMVKSLDSPSDAVVLEANTAANISVHHIPGYGKPVDVAAQLIDAMKNS